MRRLFRRNLFGARKRALPSPCLFAVFLLFGIARAHSTEILVFAAASLTDALRQIATSYENHSPDKIFFNFAASSTLARQIEEGSPADIFFSADEEKMDALENRGLIVNQTRTNLLSNALVIITPGGENAVKIHSPSDLTNAVVKRIALADPRAVPAGIYSKAFLHRQKLWSVVESKIVPTENVRGALAAVESGNADAGMVYKTDAAISKKARVAYEVSAGEAPEIRYPVAIVKDSKQIEAARKFLQYLESDDAGKIFKKFGFVALD
ncbi:MAG TPA: molybdate ABC transporter substrate-binding protein [Verrucomicrobiae bacterium]|nr:molybdate ABC transporter substrate-binding protein [Verrucomicrobiae bacterium]